MKAVTRYMLGFFLLFSGCVTVQTPVRLSPAYRAQVASAASLVGELNRRAIAGTIDPNEFVLVLTTTKQTLDNILKADSIGGYNESETD